MLFVVRGYIDASVGCISGYDYWGVVVSEFLEDVLIQVLDLVRWGCAGIWFVYMSM